MSSAYPSSQSHALSGASNRSLAVAASTPLPLSPFSPNSLEQHNSLAPPSLHQMQSDAQVMRALYPSVSSSAHAAFAPEPTVYRSVTMADNTGLGHSPFDPLSHFDRSGGSGGYAKELGLNPKMHSFQVTQQAEYKPTLKHLQMPTLKAHVPAPQVAVAAASPIPSDPQIPPPQAPVWLEPNSHFFCTCDHPHTPATLFDTVQRTLLQLHENTSNPNSNSICTLDCTPVPARYKLSCTAYANRSGGCTPFVVRIFTADAASNKYCVEFQRRQGDCTHFFDIFRVARAAVQTAHPLKEDGMKVPPMQHAASLDSLNLGSLDITLPRPMLRSWSAPPLPKEHGYGATFTKEQICETVRSLLLMCASNCIDIKMNGVLALAELCCSPSFDDAIQHCSFNLHETLVAEGCFQLFLDCLPIEQIDIHRASLTALANLSETQSHVCNQVLSDDKSLRAVLSLAASQTNQVVRECARLMANCAKQVTKQVSSNLLHKIPYELVEKLMQHSDAHCRKHAADIKQCMRETQGNNNMPISAQ